MRITLTVAPRFPDCGMHPGFLDPSYSRPQPYLGEFEYIATNIVSFGAHKLGVAPGDAGSGGPLDHGP